MIIFTLQMLLCIVKWCWWDCLIVVNTALESFLSNKFMCLFIFAVFTICKRSLMMCLLCWSYRRGCISCKWLINILFAVCKLSVWISASCLQVAEIVYKMIDDVNKLLQRYILAEIVCNVIYQLQRSCLNVC